MLFLGKVEKSHGGFKGAQNFVELVPRLSHSKFKPITGNRRQKTIAIMTRINIRDYLHFREDDECKLRQDEKDEMLEAFTLYDKDRDGIISTREVGTVIRSLGQLLTVCEETDIVTQFTQEQCNDINFIAFYRLMTAMRRDFDEENELIESFRRFDKEDKGYVDKDELKSMLLTIGEPLTVEEVDGWLNDGKPYTKGGKLYYEEFVSYMLSK